MEFDKESSEIVIVGGKVTLFLAAAQARPRLHWLQMNRPWLLGPVY
jgi:hypothetical protein